MAKHTPEQLQALVLQREAEKAIQRHLDSTAQSLRWDNIKSARAAAGVPLDGTESAAEIAIHNEAVALAKWDRQVWAYAGTVEAELFAGTRTSYPTPDELIAELPVFGV